MIKKDPLRLVLAEDEYVTITEISNNMTYMLKNGELKSINIYEFADKCKNWALLKDYEITSTKGVMCTATARAKENDLVMYSSRETTELKAIFVLIECIYNEFYPVSFKKNRRNPDEIQEIRDIRV